MKISLQQSRCPNNKQTTLRIKPRRIIKCAERQATRKIRKKTRTSRLSLIWCSTMCRSDCKRYLVLWKPENSNSSRKLFHLSTHQQRQLIHQNPQNSALNRLCWALIDASSKAKISRQIIMKLWLIDQSHWSSERNRFRETIIRSSCKHRVFQVKWPRHIWLHDSQLKLT